MGLLKKIAEGAAPPSILYLYMTPQELLELLETTLLHAPDLRCANHDFEFIYTAEIINETIQDQYAGVFIDTAPGKGEANAATAALLREILYRLDTIEHYHLFACSFFQEGDHLANWTGGAKPKRFSLGFDMSNITGLTGGPLPFHLRQCIFDRDRQKIIIQERLREAVQASKALSGEETGQHLQLTNIAEAFVLDAIHLSAVFRHPSFFQGIEWRLFSPPLTVVPPEATLHFQGDDELVTPVLKIRLDRLRGPQSPLREIIIGPTQCPDLSAGSLERLLAANDLEDCRVRISTIPFTQ